MGELWQAPDLPALALARTQWTGIKTTRPAEASRTARLSFALSRSQFSWHSHLSTCRLQRNAAGRSNDAGDHNLAHAMFFTPVNGVALGADRSASPVLTELMRENSGMTPRPMRRPTLRARPFHRTTCRWASGTYRSVPGRL